MIEEIWSLVFFEEMSVTIEVLTPSNLFLQKNVDKHFFSRSIMKIGEINRAITSYTKLVFYTEEQMCL